VPETQNQKAGTEPGLLDSNPGDDLLSHAVARAVPWALEGLTSVFGMGTGVSPPVWSPKKQYVVGGRWHMGGRTFPVYRMPYPTYPPAPGPALTVRCRYVAVSGQLTAVS
jgi:hypothetical protein